MSISDQILEIIKQCFSEETKDFLAVRDEFSKLEELLPNYQDRQKLMRALEERFKDSMVEIPDEIISKLVIIDDLADFITKKLGRAE